jgi:hypothetical protein
MAQDSTLNYVPVFITSLEVWRGFWDIFFSFRRVQPTTFVTNKGKDIPTMSSLLSFVSLAVLASAVPIVDSSGIEYHSLEARQANLPLLKLPYGTWQASKYDAASDVRTTKGRKDTVQISALTTLRSTHSKTYVTLLHQLVAYDGPNPSHQL